MVIRSLAPQVGAVFALAVTTGAAIASGVPSPAAYDTSPVDGSLSLAEQQAYRSGLYAARQQHGDSYPVQSAIFHLNAAQQDAAGGDIPLADLGARPPADTCNGSKKGFYLRAKVSDQPIIGCKGFSAAAKGASLTYNRNGITKSDQLVFKLGMAFPLTPNKVTPDASVAPTGLRLTDYGFAVFAEGSGKINSGAANTGETRVGLMYNASYDSNVLAKLKFVASAYVEKKLDDNSRSVGVTAKLIPYSAAMRLNSTPGALYETGIQSHWTTSFAIDASRVVDAGSSTLTKGDSAVWGIFKLGYVYQDDKIGAHGARFSVEAVASADALSSRRTRLLSASAELFLDAPQKLSISADWEKGTPAMGTAKKDELAVKLKFRF